MVPRLNAIAPLSGSQTPISPPACSWRFQDHGRSSQCACPAKYFAAVHRKIQLRSVSWSPLRSSATDLIVAPGRDRWSATASTRNFGG
ncbi:hypothetical protein SAMN05216188_121112 [Lentzea xinjiangensis]|uniref:Uncharacterized protein n=1 Tax=Lentzea xinjiangensis TaxID=402600 RepID=A0A1H9UGY3_9PSEU|nr:hypothetical protein SAMN05216188_121112 [Lentzea xinjiangensis]